MNLTPQQISEINRTIAEAFGWKILDKPDLSTECACYAKDPLGFLRCGIPNYCGDLNAIQDAVANLNTGQLIIYTGLLYEMAGADVTAATAHFSRGSYDACKKVVLYEAGKSHLVATPYRCQAFITTLYGPDKWEELTK